MFDINQSCAQRLEGCSSAAPRSPVAARAGDVPKDLAALVSCLESLAPKELIIK